MQEEQVTGTAGRRWIVMKFGGTSVSSIANWDTICRQARQRLEDGWHVLIVVSALSGITDRLTRLGQCRDKRRQLEILEEIEKQHEALLSELGLEPGPAFRSGWQTLAAQVGTGTRFASAGDIAALLANGERLASAIGEQVLRQAGLGARLQDATQLLAAEGGDDDSPLSASCGAGASSELEQRLAGQGALHITQGFLVAGPDGATWLLGRGGSDTSAACLASRLSAEKLEIWTDVPGIFTADPRVVPHARLLQRLSYSEAQELASMGAKVLHPPCVRVCKQAGVPLQIRDTTRPRIDGTRVGPRSAATNAQVKGIVSRGHITLVMMENPSMWRQVGFLAEAFGLFRKHGLSVDLIATSESSVTVSLDPGRAGADDTEVLDALVADLSSICTLQLHRGCVSISLVGNAIRTILGRLSEALDVFQDRKIYMVTQSANDLNLTLVVDAEHADRLVQKLHELLISPRAGSQPEFGDSWAALTHPAPAPPVPAWWEAAAEPLMRQLGEHPAAFVYDMDTVRRAAESLRNLQSVDRVLYAVKANDHPQILQTLQAAGIGFDCVSAEEIRHLTTAVPAVTVEDILFTPNFAGRGEYAEALDLGVCVTIDNIHPLMQWTDLFRGREIFLRVDLNLGHGHHRKVITSGSHSKFGISMAQLETLPPFLAKHGIRVTGLHAHTGSGVHDAAVWQEQMRRLQAVMPLFPSVRVLDLGGGLGVPETPGQPALDLERLDELLGAAAAATEAAVWLEPGRFLVAQSGVLLARVTQVKSKDDYHYLGLTTGMNSLIRPALYGAYHEIVNLTRLGQPARHRYNVVGPICESGDVLGESRFLPASEEGDIVLIANAGAYGRVMSSHYNRRAPAVELIFDRPDGV